jgi:hypothetical protein
MAFASSIVSALTFDRKHDATFSLQFLERIATDWINCTISIADLSLWLETDFIGQLEK